MPPMLGLGHLLTTFVLLCCIRGSICVLDYCNIEENLCGGARHVACELPNEMGESCSDDASFIKFTLAQQALILKEHNLKRSMVASGKLAGFYQAKHMPILVWDNELAYLAGVNVKNCNFAHDQCRNTVTFSNVGQNIAITKSSSNFQDVSSAIVKMVCSFWFAENGSCTMNDINEFLCEGERLNEIGHFTQMVSDRVTKIGCAMVKYTEDEGWKSLYLVCNYSFNGNILGEPIYQRGRACSGCTKGCDSVYKGLCKL